MAFLNVGLLCDAREWRLTRTFLESTSATGLSPSRVRRPAPVTAASFRHDLAPQWRPRRTFLGVGAGNFCGSRSHGQCPAAGRIPREFDRFLETLKPLLRCSEVSRVDVPIKGDIPIRHVMPDKGFVNFEAREFAA